MLCAISGEPPQVPVASRKSGTVFEKALIESYIAEHGKDPTTGEELGIEDLIDLNTARIVKPRPPTLTSIPALLSVFQNEWDALALESFALKQQLTQLRQELSTALYSNDAAVRVIARLTRERDEARDALGKVSINDRKATNGDNEDAMQVDGQGLPASVAAKIEATQEQLSKTRRKRPVPEDWATAETIQSFGATGPAQLVSAGSRALSLNTAGDLAFIGGLDGLGTLYSIVGKEIVELLNGASGAINDTVFIDAKRTAVATSTGEVVLFQDGAVTHSFTDHAGSASALALHPCGELLLSVGEDKSFVLYDLENNKPLTRVFTNSHLTCCKFHPDGHIFAAGGIDGQIKVFDVRTSANVANFDGAGTIKSLSFSENGTWLASVVKGSSNVRVWDLRKANEIKSLDFGSTVDSIEWDYTGQFLVGAGPSGVAVQHYDKASKSWSEPLRKAVSAAAVRWGAHAKSLVVLTGEGAIEFLQ